MTDINSELKARLIIGRKQDGRCRYDPQAKRELVEACLVPGVSVARLALEHGLNANLLRSWVTAYKRKRDGGAIVSAPVSSKPTTAFVPVIAAQTQPMQAWAGLQVRLPNGVKIELNDVRDDQVRSLLHAQSTLPCSDSTRG